MSIMYVLRKEASHLLSCYYFDLQLVDKNIYARFLKLRRNAFTFF